MAGKKGARPMPRRKGGAKPAAAANQGPSAPAGRAPVPAGVSCSARGREISPETARAADNPHERYRALPEIVQQIVETCDALPAIDHLGGTQLPQSEAAVHIIEVAREIFFPGYYGDRSCARDNLAYHIGDRLHELYLVLAEQVYRSVRLECRREGAECPHCRSLAEANAQQVLRCIPEIRRLLELDVKAAYDGDPAAKSFDEIILSYPGLFAIAVYRLAHELWLLGVQLLARMMTEYAHAETGIDIHPGATIGESFFMDHGTGIVIGETTVIGRGVKLYQGVTLGALSFPKDACGKLVRGQKRHPTIEDGATIYAHATILGGTTVVGQGSTVGGNVWLTEPVPPQSFVTMEGQKLVVRSRHSPA
jgi:serine O-acetyltransferase